jgi:hypothetical protein
MVYSLTSGKKKEDKRPKTVQVTSVTPKAKIAGAAKKTTAKKAVASNAGKTTKPRPSAADVKRELAMQARGSGKNAGKKVGPKATARRLLAKRSDKSTARQETAMMKRGKK